MHYYLFKTDRRSAWLSRILLAILVLSLSAPLPAEEKTAEKNNPAASKSRMMEFRVCDEQSKPLLGAKLFANVVYHNESKKIRIVNSDLVADSDGVMTLKLPARTQSMRLWVSKPDYVSEYISFGEGDPEKEKQIPDHFEFQLARGTQISGVVVDESGQPIPKVTVSVSLTVGKPDKSADPLPIISISTEAVTDKTGKWSVNIAPAKRPGKDVQFRLQFTHKDYISDSRWGELQALQNLTTAMLRDGTARIVLRRGQSIKGTVLNTAGDPVTKGIVVWNDAPYFGSTVNETKIDQSGHFETLSLPPGKHPVTVVAPGFMPVRQIVDVNQSLKELTFAMKPGKRLTLKIVDADGNPVPKASVSLQGWHGAKSLYNVRHSNVLNSGIPTRADENGIYVWDWAPDDPVTYRILGKISAKTVTLVATEKPHVIKLDPPFTVSGNVTDARTGKPVSTFRVIPVIEFRPDFLTTSFSNAVKGKAGNFKITLDPTMDDYRRLIRIEADGYRSALSQSSYGLGDGSVIQNFTLEPAPSRRGKVVNSDGKPVVNAAIRIGTPTIVPIVSNGKSDPEGMPANTTAEGEFEIAATFEPTRIRATHESGYAEVLRQPGEAIGTLTLQPWAAISGRLMQSGKPVGGETIQFKPIQEPPLGSARLQDTYTALTDENGRFEFKQLPPIAGSVRAILGPWVDSPLTSGQSIPLDLQPGEHQTIALGNQGVTLTGTVVESGRDQAPLNKKWSINYLIRREGGLNWPVDAPSLNFDPTQPLRLAALEDPNFTTWQRTRLYYFVKLAADGQLKINGVPPGKYDLLVQLYEPPAGCLVNPVGQKIIPVEVTEQNLISGTLALGQLTVPCKLGPQQGSNLYAFEFTDPAGQAHSIYELKGRYVLLQAWASWCAPCLKSMPEIQALTAQYPEQKLTVIGLNVDQDPLEAQNLVKRKGWNWTQHYMEAETERARRLTVSSVPIYFLVGPDGVVTSVSKDWNEMQQTINKLLKEKSAP
ncbi:Thiol-disulfide oxidoreductase ResA [Gimesia panareensis]|nr:Thiol-disulfide oxidoreductase ResA [Gimesia panareensis]